MEFRSSCKTTAITSCLRILLILILVVACFSGCSQQGATKWISDPYIYQNSIPCTDEPEDWIALDGKTSEKEWDDNSWLKYSTGGVTFYVTTEFTKQGLYIAGKADDPYVYHHGDYRFAKNTSFEIYVVREDETEVNVNNRWLYRPGRFVRLHIDPLNTVSYTNTPCNTATWVDGTLNTAKETEYHDTKGWGFECFISWEAMRLEDKYFAEDGIPESVKLCVNYMMIDGENENKINTNLDPINTEFFRYHTYWTFDRQGLVGDYSSAILNNSPDGPAATDQLIYSSDESGKLVVTCPVNRTQMTWAQGPSSENFSIEATFTIGEDAITGYTGLGFILYNTPVDKEGYNIFSVNAGALRDSNALQLSSSMFTDGLNWLEGFSFNEVAKNDFESPYGNNSVHLKLVKIGGYMYYYVDNQFYKAEFLDNMKGAVNAGLFFNCTGSVTDYSYEDYSGREEELLATVRDHVYYVNLPGVTTYGSVTSQHAIIPQGETITLEVNPGGGYILGDILNNGVSFLADLKGTKYTFTPTEDVNVTADFHRLGAEESCEIALRITDPQGETLSGVSYSLKDDEGKLVYQGKDNGRGMIIVSVPKKGTIQTETQTNQFSGSYTISLTKNNYIPVTIRFEVGENSTHEDTVVMESFDYGSVTVNGKKTSDAKGTFWYDTAVGIYHSGAKSSSGREVAYHQNYIGKSYYAAVDIYSLPATGTPNVPGISISTGGGAYIYLKVSPWDANQLFIHCGKTNGKDAAVSVSGFAHKHTAAGGTAIFSVLRKGENVFVFDAEGDLAIVLNKQGIHTVGDHAFVNKTLLDGTNANVSNFFTLEDQDHAIGIYNDYNNGSAGTYFDIEWSADPALVSSKLASVKFVPFNTSDSSAIHSIELAGAYDPEFGFISGSTGYMYVKTADEKQAVSSMTIHYADGTSEICLAKYNSLTGKSEVSFVLNKPVVNVSYQINQIKTVSGTLSSQTGAISGAEVIFTDTTTGAQFKSVSGSDGKYAVSVFVGNYNVLAVGSGFATAQENVSVQNDAVLDLNLSEAPHYIGSAVVNNKQVNSSDCVNTDVTMDALDGKVTIPYNNRSMIAVLGNQVFTGADDFEYTIRINGQNMPVAQGTQPSATQMGFGLTDGNNWWVFFVKIGEGQGKSVGIGVNTSGYGGGDFVYGNTISVNSLTAAGGNTAINADVVLTIEKTGTELSLYAGEGAGRVKLLTASAAGYSFDDPNATFVNKAAEAGQLSKLGAFFDSEREFALCLGSFYYNADITFEIEIE